MVALDDRLEEEIVEEFARYVSPSKVTAYRQLGFAVVPGRREGVRLWDWEGKRSYINLRSSGGVFNLGHRPPRIMAALREAMEAFDVGDHILMSERRAALAHRLAELTPGDITYTAFAASGGEAIDIALKLARGHTRRPGVISADVGYHGHTGLALAATAGFSEQFGPLAPGFVKVPFGDFEALERTAGPDTAAIIMETIPATAGMLIPPDDYYPRLRRLCDERGIVMIIDEVQAGLGRTGRLWAIDEWKVVPDIVVLGKGMSGAIYPLAVACYRPWLQAFFDANPFAHLSSYGGADLGCAVALAMLEEITAAGFLEHVREIADRFEAGFAALKEAHPDLVAGLRQRGLMMALELTSPQAGTMMTGALGRHGVLALFSHYRPQALQVMPPLIISAEEVDEVMDAFDKALADVRESMGTRAARPAATA